MNVIVIKYPIAHDSGLRLEQRRLLRQSADCIIRPLIDEDPELDGKGAVGAERR